MDVGDEFASNAAAFLEASRSRDARRTQDLADSMHDELDRFIRRTVRARTLPGRDGARANEDDVVQEVLRRLLASPPTRAIDRSAADVTLLAWAKTVTVDYMLELRRRARSLSASLPGADGAAHGEVSQPVASNFRDHAETTGELAMIERALTGRYPRGLEVFAIQRTDPELDDAEIAARVGTTAANVYKIRHRIRAVVAESLSEESAGALASRTRAPRAS